MCDDNRGPLDSFADSLDPLHLDDTLFGNGDGHTSFDEFMIGQDDDDDYSGNSDYMGDEEDFDMDDGGAEMVPLANAGNRHPVVSRPGPTITLTFSVAEPERKVPTEGVWKYFERDYWHFAQALIDRFPELEPDYDDRSDLREMIVETYEIDKPRAIRYLYWLWENFPKTLFEQEGEEDFELISYLIRWKPILELIQNNGHDEYLYEQLKSDVFIQAAFFDGVIKKHDMLFPESYVRYLFDFCDFDAAMKAYDSFLKGQKGRYGEVDIGKLWLGIARSISWNEKISFKETLELLSKIRPVVEGIGIRGVKVLKEIDAAIERAKDNIACEEEYIEG